MLAQLQETRTLLHLVLFALFLHTAVGTDPLFYVCSSTSGNFTANSPYATNLNRLKNYLYRQTPRSGFSLGEVGSNPDQVYGLASCRGDVNFTTCQSCIGEAKDAIAQLCPSIKEGTIWYDFCQLKYSNSDFFHKVDIENESFSFKFLYVSDPASYIAKTNELLSSLSQQASINPRLFATGSISYNATTAIYGLAQCTRDLSNPDCKTCLNETISQLQCESCQIPSCCSGTQGGIGSSADGFLTGSAVGESCNVRYDIYPFVNS